MEPYNHVFISKPFLFHNFVVYPITGGQVMKVMQSHQGRQVVMAAVIMELKEESTVWLIILGVARILLM